MTFKLMTDSCCDLPYKFLEKNDVDFLSMSVHLNNRELIDDLGNHFDNDWFLQEIKNGGMPTTSQINAGQYLEKFRPYVEAGIPILYLSFSSSLSGSYHSAMQAVAILKEDFDEVSVSVIDTKAASLGEGLLVAEAIRLKNTGHSIEEIIAWIAENKMHVQSWVTVDDLNHLERGGRISKTAAAIGNLIHVKPIISVDAQGKLQTIGKVRGRGKALQKLVDETIDNIERPLNQTIYIAYAGEVDSAEKVKQLIKNRIQIKKIELLPLGPTIASHTGYGCVAVFSFGKKRT